MATRKKKGSIMQVLTSCISTTMVLLLLGMVLFFVLIARNLSDYVRSNMVVTVLLKDDATKKDISTLSEQLEEKIYIHQVQFLSKEDALKEQSAAMGSDPSEFLGSNPFSASFELKLLADYANSDSLKWIETELKANQKITDIAYQQDIMDGLNANLRKLSILLLIIASLLTFVSFGLINNTIRLNVYSKRFLIHTMKLVGASWAFIRRPFILQSLWIGVVSASITNVLLLIGVNALINYLPALTQVITWQPIAIMVTAVFSAGILITLICALLSVNKFLRMTAGELYKI